MNRAGFLHSLDLENPISYAAPILGINIGCIYGPHRWLWSRLGAVRRPSKGKYIPNHASEAFRGPYSVYWKSLPHSDILIFR